MDQAYVPDPTEIFFECEEYVGREGVWVDYLCGACWARWWAEFVDRLWRGEGGEDVEMKDEGDVVMGEEGVSTGEVN